MTKGGVKDNIKGSEPHKFNFQQFKLIGPSSHLLIFIM